MQSPCLKNCSKRSVTCHSHCKDYLDWKSKLNKYNEQKRKDKKAESVATDYKMQAIMKMKRGQ